MNWNAAHAVSAVFALALTAVLAGQAHAGSCEGSDRIDRDDAECLDANWNNRKDLLSRGEVWATNKCSDYGTVVVKVDIKSAKDKTWHLDHGNKKKEGTGLFDTRSVSCCADLSDLCNKSDLANVDSCVDRWRYSSANESCIDTSVAVNDDLECVFTSRCRNLDGDRNSSTIAASWPDTVDLHNCDGVLRLVKSGSCPGSN